MRQDKCIVVGVFAQGEECLCQTKYRGMNIALRVPLDAYTEVGISEEVLVEWNEFTANRTSVSNGKLIAKRTTPDIHGIDYGKLELSTFINMSEQQNEEKEMQNHMVEIMLENFFTIGIRFKGSHKTYTYKVDKDLTLEVDDKVIVQTTSGFEIVNVVRVDEGMDIDFNSDIKYKFIVQKLDLTRYEELVDNDKNVAAIIAQGAAKKVKAELLEQYVGILNEDQKKLLEDCGVKAVDKL